VPQFSQDSQLIVSKMAKSRKLRSKRRSKNIERYFPLCIKFISSIPNGYVLANPHARPSTIDTVPSPRERQHVTLDGRHGCCARRSDTGRSCCGRPFSQRMLSWRFPSEQIEFAVARERPRPHPAESSLRNRQRWSAGMLKEQGEREWSIAGRKLRKRTDRAR